MSRFAVHRAVALVTGAGAGIGLATAAELAGRGASVLLVDRDDAAVAAAAARLGPRTAAVTADVTDPDAMTAAVAEAVRVFGRLDLVVANAGVTPPPATLRTGDPADFRRVVEVNLHGALHTVRPAIEQLITHRGHVVVVASCAAYSPPLGGSAYMVSKAAVEVLARALRLELAPHRVGVTTVAFGFVDTGLARATLDEHEVGPRLSALLPGPLRRRITPADAARVIARGAARRAVRVTAPRAWAPLGVLRGVLSPLVDAVVVRGPGAGLVRLLEREHRAP
ncbi:NADP-dependent 3-hydroxy acid dehydrogenase YdfG [Pseudonocardia ammonioxydans]|uniref:NADP-dependent 3-hydroxy acid dehydrogenase YdfG n=1 Tax=Pseudonocardia ammonioxydans TaxID=260086 RepID=A0A1I5G7S5_PSUAM|nr:SDR family NAD(P)-dependent oxidoreductase [Pseudonocardia ammonioxydans]SFO32108.1 NADP-dependent 3-hydroxy acid dehydrogenase YdfG [Pseudonocardia ammonioxydans]